MPNPALQEYLHTLIGYLCMYAEYYRIAMRAGREHWMQSGEDAVVGGVFELMQDSAQATLRREFKDTILPDLLALLRSLGPLSPTVSRMDAIIEAWVKEDWRAKEPAVVALAAWTSAQTLLTNDICRLVCVVPSVEHVLESRFQRCATCRNFGKLLKLICMVSASRFGWTAFCL